MVPGAALRRHRGRLALLAFRGCRLDRHLHDDLPLGARMTTWQALTTTWDWEPSVLIGCTALIGVYIAATRRRPSRHAGYFFAGVVVLLLAQCSPLDALGDTYL